MRRIAKIADALAVLLALGLMVFAAMNYGCTLAPKLEEPLIDAQLEARAGTIESAITGLEATIGSIESTVGDIQSEVTGIKAEATGSFNAVGNPYATFVLALGYPLMWLLPSPATWIKKKLCRKRAS